MNEGVLAILIVLSTIGAAIWVAIHRDVIYPKVSQPETRTHARPMLQRSARPGRRPETEPKQPAIVSVPVSGVATPKDEPEMIAFRVLAKLIAAGLVTETAALETAFDVRAGSSKAYKAAQAKLKAAQVEVESSSAPAG